MHTRRIVKATIILLIVFLFFVNPVIVKATDDMDVSMSLSTQTDQGQDNTAPASLVEAAPPNTTPDVPAEKPADQNSVSGSKEEALLAPLKENINKDVPKVKDSLKSPTGAVAQLSQTQNQSSLIANSLSLDKQPIIQPDPATGALIYDYPVFVPPGRNGMQPELTLQYNSQDAVQDGVFGIGWSLNIPYITRINKKGSSTLFIDNYFSSSLSGELVNNSGNNYSSKVENGNFLKYIYASNVWTVIDKGGKIYTFGSQSSARQDDPNDPGRVYKWMLEKIQDANGNFISYAYYKDSGQIYPASIVYTGNGANPGIFSVIFSRESRVDTIQSSTPGFISTTNYRISQIQALVNNTWAHSYSLVYTSQSPSLKSSLSSITESGQVNSVVTSLPSSNFSYQLANGGGWIYDSSWQLPVDQSTPGCTINGQPCSINPITSNGTMQLIDVNGDALPDFVQNNWQPYLIDSYCVDNPTHPFCSSKKVMQYIYLNTGLGWIYDPSWQLPADQGTLGCTINSQPCPVDLNSTTGHFQIMDVNGDALPDLIENYWNSLTNNDVWCAQNQGYCLNPIVKKQYIYLNNGHGWTYDSSWQLPADQSTPGCTINGQPCPVDLNLNSGNFQIADINGDGLPDFLQNSDKRYIYLNNGHGWTYDSSWELPGDQANPNCMVSGKLCPINSSMSSGHIQFVDVNGDALPDFIENYWNNQSDTDEWCASHPGSCPDSIIKKQYIYLNNGHGWTYDSSWQLPADQMYIDLSAVYGPHYTINGQPYPINLTSIGNFQITDLNSDGLVDFLQNNWNSMTTDQFCADHSGCPPIIKGQYIYLNTGHGWKYDPLWSLPVDKNNLNCTINGQPCPINPIPSHGNFQLTDVDGNGSPDFVENYLNPLLNDQFCSDNPSCPSPRSRSQYIYLNNVKKPLLSLIALPSGGNIAVSYIFSAQSKDSAGNLQNPRLPFILQAVDTITNADTVNFILSQDRYAYSNGYYYFNSEDPFSRKFAGFNIIAKADLAGNISKTFFHQGNNSDSGRGEDQDDYWKIGRMYGFEIADSAGNIYQKTINKWDDIDLGNTSKFVKLLQTVNLTYDGDATHRDSAEGYDYNNANGNIIQKTQYGEVKANDDGSFSDIGADAFTTSLTYAAGGNILGLVSKSTITDQGGSKIKESKSYYDSQPLNVVIKGNLTRQENLKSGVAYIAAQKTYNSYGLVASLIDPLNNITQYSYDACNLYPSNVTNAKNQSIQYSYDYASGQVLQKTDENSRIFQYSYDGLGRLIEERQPDISSSSVLVVKSAYSYVDTPNAFNVKKSNYLDGSNFADSYTYLDDLGRKIQERHEAEGASFSVKDYSYNNVGHMARESLPYFSSGPARTPATQDPTLYTNYIYDAVGRVINSQNAVGRTINAYDDWKLTTTDANSKTKDIYQDVYGNIVQVDEHNAGNIYSTFYQYDYLGNVIKITDVLQNIRNFTYDNLGRRLTAQDLHAPADTTFGTWSYVYDYAGNVIQTTDPKNQITSYTYDSLNRQITEDYTGATGIEVTYSYDSGIDGIGKLSSVANSSITRSYVYNLLGLIRQETDVLGGANYITSYDYDRQGNQMLITNPDNSQIKNIYNSAGLLDQTQRKESTDGAFIDVVSNFNYSPEGKITMQANYNGVVTTNTYDAAKLYRLIKKVTMIAGGLSGQNIAYTYDPVGNITNAIDSSDTDASKASQYTYDDLYRLISAMITNPATGQTPYIQSYTYDPIGNLLTKSDITGTYVYAGTGYANPHAVTSIASDILSYDNNGNLLTSQDGSAYKWDYKNRLVEATKGSVKNTYAYDVTGQRVMVISSNATTYYPTACYNTATAGTTTVNSSQTSSSLSADPSLIAYWKLDEVTTVAGATIIDSSGNQNKGTPKGVAGTNNLPRPGSSVPAAIASISPKSLNFDGTDDYVLTSLVAPSGTNARTIAAWIKNSVTDTTYQVIGDYGAKATAGEFQLFTNGNKLGLAINGASIIYNAPNLNNGSWHHIAVSVPSGAKLNSIVFYVDGVKLDSISSGTSASAAINTKTNNTFRFGTDISGTGFFKGNLDDIRVYNRNLSQVEITDIFNPPITSSVTTSTTGTMITKHTFANGQDIATIDGTGAAVKVYYATVDLLNSSSIMTDSAGALTETLDYFPFGSIRIDKKAGSFSEQRKYIGQEYDIDTGLNYLNARYYNGSIGKFISQDPMFWSFDQKWLLDPQNQNSYSYARNNPITSSDPSGLFVVEVAGTKFFGGGAEFSGKGGDILQSNIQ
ncbi:hypothetical protein KW786_01675, partial [Candidatus Parcubacteria bacterium]|nr:hypothetical protein [Candidatus Parcubacteria bacterium]